MKQLYSAVTKNKILSSLILSFTSFILYAQPTVVAFAPSNGSIGSSINIFGTNFNSTAANNIVYFGATKATVNTATLTQLTVTVPLGATYQPVSVFNTATGLTGFLTKPYGFISTFTGKSSITASDFTAKQNFTTGTGPSGICIFDIDGDGKADIATANNSSGNISILRNTSTSGTLSFAAKVDIATGTLPAALAIGDIDNDGKPDLIVANTYLAGFAPGSSITVYRNTSSSGSISFASGVSFTTNSEPYSIAIGDINGDGKADLAVANYNSGGNPSTVSILRNTSSAGSVSFATKVDLAVTDAAGGVSIGDLDGDGKPDIAVANSGSFGQYGSSVSVYRNTTTTGNSTLSFGSKQDFATGSSPYPVNMADFDGDGNTDLVTANFADDNISVLRNTSSSGSISFAAQLTFATGDGNSFLGIGDLDGDGKVDIAVVNFGSSSTGNTVSVLRNNSTSGNISFNTKVDLSTGIAPYEAAVGDLDGDGKADIAVSNYGTAIDGTTVSVLRNTPQGVLPLKLLGFTGRLINNNHQVELNWQTTDEINVSRYEAQWSSDSRNWQVIATLTARNNLAINNYSCLHSALSPVNFYRLKMIDIDDKFVYSPILQIDLSGSSSFALYPDPATDNITLTGLGNKPAFIRIMNTDGKIMLQKNLNVNATTIDVSKLSSGFYLMLVIQNNESSVHRFVKE